MTIPNFPRLSLAGGALAVMGIFAAVVSGLTAGVFHNWVSYVLWGAFVLVIVLEVLVEMADYIREYGAGHKL